MELQLVKKDINNESDYYCLEEDMIYHCNELLEEKNLPLVTFKIWYDLSYSQWSWVWFREFNISFDELIKYLLEIKTLSKEEYDILYAAHDEWLYDFDYKIWSRNRVDVTTSIYRIPKAYSITNTYNLLFNKYWDHYIDDENEMSYNALDDILDSDQIELALKDLLDSLSKDLSKYWYSYIESEDEYQCKNILFDNFMELNNIETNIEYHEWWEYLRTKEEVLDKLWTLEYSTLVNDNNLNDYYIANDLLREIESKERTVQYYSLTI